MTRFALATVGIYLIAPKFANIVDKDFGLADNRSRSAKLGLDRSQEVKLLTSDDVAAKLLIPKSTLTAWRYHRIGPPSMKIGKHVRYDEAEVDRWLDEQARKDATRAS